MRKIEVNKLLPLLNVTANMLESLTRVVSPEEAEKAGVTPEAATDTVEALRVIAKDGIQPSRTRLPETRESMTRKECVGKIEMYVTVSFYPDSFEPGEVFCQIGKEGSTMAGMADALATVVSIALQMGTPWATIADKLSNHRFEPHGLSADPKVEHSSLVDAMAFAVNLLIEKRRSVWGDAEKPG